MTNARPFSISMLQDLSNDTNNTSMQGVLALLSNSKHLGVSEDSKSLTLGVLGFTSTLGQSGVVTYGLCDRFQSKFMGLNSIYFKFINNRPLRPINIVWWIVLLWPPCGMPFIRFGADGLPFKNSLIYGFIFYWLMWLVQMKKIHFKFNISWFSNENCAKKFHS
jgi:hypothetical protein